MRFSGAVEAMPSSARFALLVLALVVFAWVFSSWQTDDASFSIGAQTEVLSVEPECRHQIVWDLPPGRIGVASEDGKVPAAAEAVSVSLRGGARARVRVNRQGQWLMEFARSNSFGCGGPAADVIAFTAGDASRAANDADVFYESTAGIAAGSGPVLLLRGRVVIGEEIQFGSGAARDVDVPLLTHARIEVRTPDAQTRQRRLIHEEAIDPASMIDTHACLDEPHDPAAASFDCVRRSGSTSEGFFRAVKRDDRHAFEVQLVATGRHVGVRNQGGSERRLLVTWWSRVVSSTFAQLFAAGLLFVAACAQVWSTIQRKERGEPEAGKVVPDADEPRQPSGSTPADR